MLCGEDVLGARPTLSAPLLKRSCPKNTGRRESDHERVSREMMIPEGADDRDRSNSSRKSSHTSLMTWRGDVLGEQDGASTTLEASGVTTWGEKSSVCECLWVKRG